MFEDKYINAEEYKKSLLDSFIYKFAISKDKIKNPYFVMYVREYLENKY
jgi:membrane carboxypeptidase/penicillin-binding protein